jgi:gliding motility-associated-like protein
MWTPAVGLSATNIANPIVSPVVTTKYFVTATLGGCSLTDSILVTVNPAPIPNAGNDVVVCFGQSAQLQGSGGVAYIWWPNSNINNATISNPLVNTNATTTYYLHVKDANGCTSLKADTVTVVVTPPLQVDAGKDTTIVMNQPYQMSSTLVGYSNIGATFLWTPSFGLNNSAIQNPIATINVPTTYVVQITTPAGCKGLDTVKLNVLVGPTIYVPTVFTPNNDGKNDLFKVVPVGISKINFIRLYNRWGQEVFATTNANIGWDARNKGVEQPTGAYVYYVQGVTDTGKVLSFKGTVLLAR